MEKPTKTAIMLSAVMAPGAGQFVQRRWVVGAFFLIAFLVCLVFLLVEIVWPMAANILASLDFAERKPDVVLVKYRVAPILAWSGLSLVVYLAGLLDTAAAYYRQCREWSRQHSRLWTEPAPTKD
ncbi:MAG: hypothetical protein KKE37_12450 [Verrucomicrobia bacterium]|nr:hypothetical protein [Verrucomicrobiota bacterium]MBU4289631.1 hypothetical protein [Verrucomicrobiota bacterium]MBU4430148.1 hypothetical protein [Verrucomicrobiota bacterium]MCG2679495.1 hypothetical protein [Kiritimatiellia bacterium]